MKPEKLPYRRLYLVAGILSIVMLFGCGGPRAPAPDPAPSCEDVAKHLLELANQDNRGQADPGLAAGIVGEFAQQCTRDGWSPKRRTCLHGARTQEQTLRCPSD